MKRTSFRSRDVGMMGFLSLMLGVGSWPANAATPPTMESRGAIKGLHGSYISMVHRGGEYQFFGNIIDTSTPGLTLFTGTTPTAVGAGEVIAPNALIDDLLDSSGQPDPTRMITRPVVRFSNKEQRYYAMVHVSRSYPPSNGRVYPALLVSKTEDPRKGWVYKGQLKGEPADLFGPPKASWTSGMAFLLNDTPGDAINHANPLANKFALYNEFGGRGLGLVYSNDGTNWFFFRNSEKKVVDVMPKEFENDGIWIFSSAVQTPSGYFMYVSSKWMEKGPAGHRLLYSKDGLQWKQLRFSPQGPKNFSLGYDAEANLIYVMPTVIGNPPYAKDLYVMTPRIFE